MKKWSFSPPTAVVLRVECAGSDKLKIGVIALVRTAACSAISWQRVNLAVKTQGASRRATPRDRGGHELKPDLALNNVTALPIATSRFRGSSDLLQPPRGHH